VPPWSTTLVTSSANTPAEPAGPAPRQRMLGMSTLAPLAALILACVFFSLGSDQFRTGGNLSLLIQQVMVLGTLAIGQMLIMLTAGIDLSNGAIMALGSVAIAELAVSGVPPLLAILLGIVLCAVLGLANGTLVTRVPLPPFIVTLAMLYIAFALTHLYSNEQTVTELPSTLTALGNTFSIGQTEVMYGAPVTVGLYLLVAYLLHRTSWGRHVYAAGDHDRRVIRSVYLAAGIVYGIAALLLVARTKVGDPQAGETDNLSSIAAVVVGGTSLSGGRGTVLGTLIGVLIVCVIGDGLQVMGVSSLYQILVTGILVILAVTVDQLTTSARARASVRPTGR
jgi:fructose transport system permease protein